MTPHSEGGTGTMVRTDPREHRGFGREGLTQTNLHLPWPFPSLAGGELYPQAALNCSQVPMSCDTAVLVSTAGNRGA